MVQYTTSKFAVLGLSKNATIAKRRRICMCLFLTNLEIPVVSTSLVAITGQLGGFDKTSWIVSAYLLGYVGTLVLITIDLQAFSDRLTGTVIIFAKLSDIFGRKAILILVVLIFTIFSGACGAAQSIEQL